MRAAIYARLSKDRSGLSVNVGIQEAEAREYAADTAMKLWLSIRTTT